MNVLVDTSVWSLAFRRKPNALSKTEASIVKELSELIEEGRAQMAGVIRQELLSGVKTDEQFEKLKKNLAAFYDVQLVTADFEEAAKASNQCRRRGIATSVVDMLVCATALRRGWSVFTTDPDFQNYSKVLAFKQHSLRNQPT